MKISREVKIGVLMVVTISLFVWGANFMKGNDIFISKRKFYAEYSRVDGLLPSNPVVINGLNVGKITAVYFTPNTRGRLTVEFVVDNDIVIPYNSVARIHSSDIMGSKAIEILLGNSQIPAQPGDTLISEIQSTLQEEVSLQMLPLKVKIEDLVGSLDSVLAVIQTIFNEETRDNLSLSFESIRKTIKNIEHTTYNLDTLMTTQRSRLTAIFSHVESITLNLKNNNDLLANIINNVSNISDSLVAADVSGVIKNANEMLLTTRSIMDKIERGEGSLGMLINNDSLYNNLSAASLDLDLLLEDMRLNPHRYIHFSVFGKSPKKNTYNPPARKSKGQN